MHSAMTRQFPIVPPASPLPTAASSTYDMIMVGTDPQLMAIGTALLDPALAPLFDPELIDAFRGMREVILYREYFHDKECNLSSVEIEYFNVKGYETLYRTLAVPHERNDPLSPQQEPCRIALLIFWHARWRIHQPNSGIFRSLTTQLKDALEQTNLKSLWHPHTGLLIWAAFMGACISVGQREHSWFIAYLVRAARVMGLRQSTDIKPLLVRFFYIDRVYGKKLEDIWEEVKMLIDAI